MVVRFLQLDFYYRILVGLIMSFSVFVLVLLFYFAYRLFVICRNKKKRDIEIIDNMFNNKHFEI